MSLKLRIAGRQLELRESRLVVILECLGAQIYRQRTKHLNEIAGQRSKPTRTNLPSKISKRFC